MSQRHATDTPWHSAPYIITTLPWGAFPIFSKINIYVQSSSLLGFPASLIGSCAWFTPNSKEQMCFWKVGCFHLETVGWRQCARSAPCNDSRWSLPGATSTAWLQMQGQSHQKGEMMVLCTSAQFRSGLTYRLQRTQLLEFAFGN